MRKTWLYSAVALVTAGTTLAVLLKDAPAQGDQAPVTSAPSDTRPTPSRSLADAGSLPQAAAPVAAKASPAAPQDVPRPPPWPCGRLTPCGPRIRTA